MSAEKVAVDIALYALKEVPELVADFIDLVRGKRPDLLPAPPESAEGAIKAEDGAAIEARFPTGQP